jgi:DNA-binding CsgD family transcriptional regulator
MPFKNPTDLERYLAALREAGLAETGEAVSHRVQVGPREHRVGRRRSAPAGLTAREVDVLRLLARGQSNKEVAAQLVISPKTVRNHVEHIYTKTGTTNRALASLFAANHGLIPDPATALAADITPGEAGSRSRGPASR